LRSHGLHKHGHRVAVRVETQAICEHNDVVVGVMVTGAGEKAAGKNKAGHEPGMPDQHQSK
jgi:hypothetical protein